MLITVIMTENVNDLQTVLDRVKPVVERASPSILPKTKWMVL